MIVVRGTAMEARIMMFVVPGEHPNLSKTTETLATITGGQVTVIETRPYVPDKSGQDRSASTEGKRWAPLSRHSRMPNEPNCCSRHTAAIYPWALPRNKDKSLKIKKRSEDRTLFRITRRFARIAAYRNGICSSLNYFVGKIVLVTMYNYNYTRNYDNILIVVCKSYV